MAIGDWATEGGRFARLLSGDALERAIYDQPILETPDCVVAPTLGSILPNWFLVVPRHPAVNFSKWSASTQKDVAVLIDKVLQGLDVSPERAIWFEHGASRSGSFVGCGVDYAHIHVLVDPPFSFDEFLSAVINATPPSWWRGVTIDAFGSIDAFASYLIAGSKRRAVIAERVESAGSQFFRRVVAQLAGKPEQWNYKNDPNLHNVQKTIAAFARQRALTASL